MVYHGTSAINTPGANAMVYGGIVSLSNASESPSVSEQGYTNANEANLSK